MRSQFGVKQDIESEDLEANISVFVTAGVRAGDLWLVSYARFDDDVLDSVHDLFEINSVFVEPVGQLKQVPLGCIFSILFIGATLDVVIRLLVDRIVGQMNKSFVQILRVVRVFLCCKTDKTFSKQEYLQRIKASY